MLWEVNLRFVEVFICEVQQVPPLLFAHPLVFVFTAVPYFNRDSYAECISKQVQMPQLLDLPQEIREIIYIAVLDLSNSILPPSSPLEAGERKKGANRCLEWGQSFENCNMYSLHPLSRSRPPLLLASRQIYDEFSEVLERQKRLGKLCYKLDCMIVAHELIYPTWLSVPILSPRLDRVDVDVRLLGKQHMTKRSKWHHSLGGPSPMLWSLFALIKRFLTRGPDFLAPTLHREQQIQLRELVINFPCPPRVPVGGSASVCRNDYEDPKDVLARLHTHMFFLMNKSSHTESEAHIIYDRVEVITFRVNGKEQMVYDLRTIPTTNSRNIYMVRFDEIS